MTISTTAPGLHIQFFRLRYTSITSQTSRYFESTANDRGLPNPEVAREGFLKGTFDYDPFWNCCEQVRSKV